MGAYNWSKTQYCEVEELSFVFKGGGVTKDPLSALMRTSQDCFGSLHLLEDLSCHCSDLRPLPDTAVTLSYLGHSCGC